MCDNTNTRPRPPPGFYCSPDPLAGTSVGSATPSNPSVATSGYHSALGSGTSGSAVSSCGSSAVAVGGVLVVAGDVHSRDECDEPPAQRPCYRPEGAIPEGVTVFSPNYWVPPVASYPPPTPGCSSGVSIGSGNHTVDLGSACGAALPGSSMASFSGSVDYCAGPAVASVSSSIGMGNSFTGSYCVPGDDVGPSVASVSSSIGMGNSFTGSYCVPGGSFTGSLGNACDVALPSSVVPQPPLRPGNMVNEMAVGGDRVWYIWDGRGWRDYAPRPVRPDGSACNASIPASVALESLGSCSSMISVSGQDGLESSMISVSGQDGLGELYLSDNGVEQEIVCGSSTMSNASSVMTGVEEQPGCEGCDDPRYAWYTSDTCRVCRARACDNEAARAADEARQRCREQQDALWNSFVDSQFPEIPVPVPPEVPPEVPPVPVPPEVPPVPVPPEVPPVPPEVPPVPVPPEVPPVPVPPEVPPVPPEVPPVPVPPEVPPVPPEVPPVPVVPVPPEVPDGCKDLYDAYVRCLNPIVIDDISVDPPAVPPTPEVIVCGDESYFDPPPSEIPIPGNPEGVDPGFFSCPGACSRPFPTVQYCDPDYSVPPTDGDGGSFCGIDVFPAEQPGSVCDEDPLDALNQPSESRPSELPRPVCPEQPRPVCGAPIRDGNMVDEWTTGVDGRWYKWNGVFWVPEPPRGCPAAPAPAPAPTPAPAPAAPTPAPAPAPCATEGVASSGCYRPDGTGPCLMGDRGCIIRCAPGDLNCVDGEPCGFTGPVEEGPSDFCPDGDVGGNEGGDGGGGGGDGPDAGPSDFCPGEGVGGNEGGGGGGGGGNDPDAGVFDGLPPLPPDAPEGDCLDRCRRFAEVMRRGGCGGTVVCKRRRVRVPGTPRPPPANGTGSGNGKCVLVRRC